MSYNNIYFKFSEDNMTSSTNTIKPAQRISKLPKYIFAQLAEMKAEAIKKGTDVIDISIGNPDGATPDPVVRVALEALQNPVNHGYPNFRGKPELRQAVADWMKKRYMVDVDPEEEVQTLIGEKEGLANIAMAYTDPGDINIIPDPYYPVLTDDSKQLYGKYRELSCRITNLYVCGRLGEFKYYNMDVTVARALELVDCILSK